MPVQLELVLLFYAIKRELQDIYVYSFQIFVYIREL